MEQVKNYLNRREQYLLKLKHEKEQSLLRAPNGFLRVSGSAAPRSAPNIITENKQTIETVYISGF